MKEIIRAKSKMVAENIRKVRVFRNYTQDYLASKLDITQNAYSKIELGYSSLTLCRLMSIADILEVDAAILISDGDELIRIRQK